MKNICKFFSCFLTLTMLFSFLVITPTLAQEEPLEAPEERVKNFSSCCENTLGQGLVPTMGAISNESSTEKFLTRLVSKEKFSFEEYFSTDSVAKEISEHIDFSSMSRFDIADLAYNAGLITEEQMIESYCDLLATKNFENVICVNPLYDKIEKFAKSNQNNVQLREKIDIALNVNSKYTPTSLIRNNMTNTLNGNNEFEDQIYIDVQNNDVSISEQADILEKAQAIRAAFVNIGIPFTNPYYIICLDTSSNSGACYTEEIQGTVDGYTYLSASRIFVSVDANGTILEDDNVIRQRLAHGMFHAIQNTYHSAGGWFKEACADWGAYAATGLTTNINLNAFINSRDSITANVGHGAMLFPLTIARYYGGAATIMEIYDQFRTLEAEDFLWDEEHWQEISFEALEWKINVSLDERGYSANFADIYTQMVTYLATPDDCYGFLGVELYNDSSAHIVYCDGDNSFEEDCLEGLEKVYFTFEPDEDLSGYTIEFTLEIFDGVGSAYQYWYNDQGEIYTSSLIINGSGQVTFTHPHYDEGNPSGFVGIAVNGIDEDEYLSIFIDYTVTSD